MSIERWSKSLLAAALPDEPLATCENCAMCPPPGEVADESVRYFSPSAKCCTYWPTLPNFSAGRVLSDDRLGPGQLSVERRIEGGMISPLGLHSPPGIQTAYEEHSDDLFGRANALICPHFVEGTADNCSIWPYRNGVCSTYFCKHERGMAGARFWSAMADVMTMAERSVGQWCAHRLGIDPAVVQRLDDPDELERVLGLLELERAETDASIPVRTDIWGDWAGRVPEFYRACAELAAPLEWSDVLTIGGVELELSAALAQRAHERHANRDLPESARFEGLRVLSATRTHLTVEADGSTQPTRIPKIIFEALPSFDGRPLAEAREEIERDFDITLSDTLLTKLFDFGLLRRR